MCEFFSIAGDANTSHSSSDSSYAPVNRSVRAPGAHGGNMSNNNNNNANKSVKYSGSDYDEFDF